MKPLLLFSFFALLIISHSCSCNKDPVVQPVYNSEFPNSIGTWWKYKVFDSLTYILDTITIKVVGITKLSDGRDANIWQINSLYNQPDTNYVYSGSDGIKIYPNILPTAPITKQYVFPLLVGGYWRGQNVKDTNRVVSLETKNVIAGSFTNSYAITRGYYAFPQYAIISKEYFGLNIGMLSWSIYLRNGGYISNQYWELVNYHL